MSAAATETGGRVAVVLFNLGGPDSLDAVKPFLTNLFSDPAIIGAPAAVRLPLARFIAWRREKAAREIYARMGGRSPLAELTEAQARVLEGVLHGRGVDARVFVCMRYWHPRSDAVAAAVKVFAPAEIVLLPLYPQYSSTTTGSSLADWRQAAGRVGLVSPTRAVCCYPSDRGFIAAHVELLRVAIAEARTKGSPRVLFSAHGLPKRVIARGDPYQAQVERTVAAVVAASGVADLDHVICYQSRVGPLEWIGPSTEEELERAGRDGVAVVVVPIAFVSDHSETLVELDVEYAEKAKHAGVAAYLRVPALGTAGAFIGGLADLVEGARRRGKGLESGDGGRICPADRTLCPCPSM